MSTFSTSVERSSPRVKPVKRPRGGQILTFLFTLLQPATYALLSTVKEQPMKAATRKHSPKLSSNSTTSSPPAHPPRQLDNIFIDALVQACHCRQHSRLSPIRTWQSNTAHLYHKPRRRQLHDTGRQVRHVHRHATSQRPPILRAPLTRDECMSMVDFYGEPYSTQAMWMEAEAALPPPMLLAPKAQEARPQIEERLLLAAVGPPPEPPPPPIPDTSKYIDPDLDHLVTILDNSDCTHGEAFAAYSALPSPGVSHISPEVCRRLFHRLSVTKEKDKDSQMRYLRVVEDMHAADLPLTESEWNSAISFCGQCFASDRDIDTGIQIWREMEQDAGVKGGNVTFNILFDMFAKAGKFVYAEKVLQEMETRKLSVNRYARVGLIYYHGLKNDGDGVRRAYREFVEAGEIVDTVVMNCVIASLIRAGEPAAAEQVYERMKHVLAKHTGEKLPSLNWKQTRDLGRMLDRAARQFKAQPLRLQQLRDEQFLAPNLHTYAIFVEHYACELGELRRVAALLNEMQQFGVPMHGRIFLKVFKGFAKHGGIRYTSWTKARLESVWNSLVEVLDQDSDVKVMKWMVIWTVRAFERCAGRERTLEIWAELRKRWKPGGDDEAAVFTTLRDILKVDDGE